MDREKRFRELAASLKEYGLQTCLRILNTRFDGEDSRNDGGPGSGNWGHAGRPGMRGGSMPGGGVSHRVKNMYGGGTFTSRAKIRRELKPVRERVGFHSLEKGELKKLPLNASVRIRGIKDTFYRDAKGILHGTNTGAEYKEKDLLGKRQISYDLLKRRDSSFIIGRPEAMQLYRDGVLDPHDVITVYRSASPAETGTELLADNGKTYRAEGGKWREVGPQGKITSPKDAPANGRGFVSGVMVGNLYELTLGQKGVSRTAVDDISDIMKTCPKGLKDSYTKVFTDCQPTVDQKGGNAFYQEKPGGGEVHLSAQSDSLTVLHEYAHYMDADAGGVKGSRMSLTLQNRSTAAKRSDDLGTITKATGLLKAGSRILNSKVECYEAGGKIMEKIRSRITDPQALGKAMDIISSVTSNSLLETANGGGHTAKYWNTSLNSSRVGDPRYCEPVAQYLTLKASGEEQALDALRELAPNLMGDLDQLYKENFGA